MRWKLALLAILCLTLFGIGLVRPAVSDWSWAAAVALWLAAGLWAYVLVAGLPVGFVIWRAMLALIPVGALAGVLIVLVKRAGATEGDLGKALVAAIVVGAGWVAGFVTQELRRTDERDELREDLVTALEVEIAFMVKRGRKVDWTVEIARARENFRTDPAYQPYVHLRLQAVALTRILERIELLSRAQIESVTAYSHLIDEVRQLTDRIETRPYARLDAARREKVFVFWLDLQSRIAAAGEGALNDLRVKPYRGLIRRPRG
jgi:hypothetical protein